MQIGPYVLPNNVLLAPMAGITDAPFRQLCHRFGAGLTVSEMVIANPDFQQHQRTLKKVEQIAADGLRSVQILGANPVQMAIAAQFNRDRGADIIDINMGCPAKKVCSTAAGSALLKDEALVARILTSVVKSIEIPVTLKIRTGWDLANRNAVNIARIAEDCGIQALTIHGRSRACKFEGPVEYDTIRQVKQTVKIPIIANGDITSAEKARQVLDYTGADAVMIGRAAQGKPWIFREILNHLQDRDHTAPSISVIREVIHGHLQNLYDFYGDTCGVRIARKHIGWYFQQLSPLPDAQRQTINQAKQPAEQLDLVDSAFNSILSGAA